MRALSWLDADQRELGRIGEAIAARHLERSGHRIQARRLQTRFAELDLLTRHGSRWHCVEVKTGRLGERYSPGMRLGKAQLARLRQASAMIAQRQKASCQVDLIEICLDRNGRLREIRVHQALRAVLPRPV